MQSKAWISGACWNMDELLKKRCDDYLLLPKRQKIRQVYGPKLLNTVQMLCFGKNILDS